jgi:hypothetical protein
MSPSDADQQSTAVGVQTELPTTHVGPDGSMPPQVSVIVQGPSSYGHDGPTAEFS